MSFNRLARFVIAFVMATSCAGAGEVTFSRDVAPILYGHCVSCHRTGDIAPMSLLTFQEVRPWAASIRAAVLTRKMPPWKADPQFGEWSNDPRLSDSEIATIKAWTEGSKSEGDPKDMPAAPDFHDGWKIGKPDLVISIPEQKLSATGPDNYASIDVPTNFQEDRWVVAAELRPSNRKVVHHAHVFVKEASSKKAVEANDPVDAYARWLVLQDGTLHSMRPEAPVIDDGCSVDDNGLAPGKKLAAFGNLLGSYLPGRDDQPFPEATARTILAGATLNFQIHYSRSPGKPETDATSVGFAFATKPPQHVFYYTYLSNQMFRIPPGSAEHKVTACHTFDADMDVMSLTPHMHLRGKAMRYIAHYPDGHEETLLNVPAYNFHWQFTYRPKKPIHLPKGTRIEVIAAFDNSANNPLNPEPGKPIRWGSASEMEMMDGWMEYVQAGPDTALGVSTAIGGAGKR